MVCDCTSRFEGKLVSDNVDHKNMIKTHENVFAFLVVDFLFLYEDLHKFYCC